MATLEGNKAYEFEMVDGSVRRFKFLGGAPGGGISIEVDGKTETHASVADAIGGTYTKVRELNP